MQAPDPVIGIFDYFIHYLAHRHATGGNPIKQIHTSRTLKADLSHLSAPECKDSPCEFFRPVTGIGSNSSSVTASALACWGSKSEIRRDESAGDKRAVK